MYRLNAIVGLMVLLFVISMTFPQGASYAGETVQEPESIRFALSSDSKGTLNKNDYMAAVKSWLQQASNDMDIPITTEVEVFDITLKKETLSYLKNYDALGLTTPELMYLGLTPEYVFFTVPHHGFYTRYVLLVHQDSGITELKALKGKQLHIQFGSWTSLARPWVEYLLADVTPQPMEQWLEESGTFDKPAKGILQVFFQQTHAVVVTKPAFELACELNPQLGKKVRILKESPDFLPLSVHFNPDRQRPILEKGKQALLKFHSSESGRQVLSIHGSTRMEKHPFSILEPTLNFLKQHQERLYGAVERR